MIRYSDITCYSIHFIEIKHIQPYWLKGSKTYLNLKLLVAQLIFDDTIMAMLQLNLVKKNISLFVFKAHGVLKKPYVLGHLLYLG